MAGYISATGAAASAARWARTTGDRAELLAPARAAFAARFETDEDRAEWMRAIARRPRPGRRRAKAVAPPGIPSASVSAGGENEHSGVGQTDADHMENTNAPEALIRPKDAAALRGVTTHCLANWADLGKIRCVFTEGGQRRYYRDDFTQSDHEIIVDIHATLTAAIGTSAVSL